MNNLDLRVVALNVDACGRQQLRVKWVELVRIRVGPERHAIHSTDEVVYAIDIRRNIQPREPVFIDWRAPQRSLRRLVFGREWDQLMHDGRHPTTEPWL